MAYRPRLVRKFSIMEPEFQSIRNEFDLNDSSLSKVVNLLNAEMDKGLSKTMHESADLKMFPTYVTSLPTGEEEGKFLALDLGGTNFRVLLIELYPGEDKPEVISKAYVVPEECMSSTGDELFDHITDCIVSFISEFQISATYLPLGFTFSFPCDQHSLTSATLVKWTKGFNCSGVEGEDIVQCLKRSLDRKQAAIGKGIFAPEDEAAIREEDLCHGMRLLKCEGVGVVALCNDTVGCLMSCANEVPSCRIGLILGTGTNACYMEDTKNIEMLEDKTSKEMIINTEWGAFGDSGCLDFIRTRFDKQLDAESLRPGYHTYEKMISGMYLGELARLIIVDLIDQGVLFKKVKQLDRTTSPLFRRDGFATKLVSKCEDDPEGGFDKCSAVLTELGVAGFNDVDCRNVRRVCAMVSRRAAHLAAAGIAALLNRLNRPFTTVAIDGTLYKKHPRFSHLLKMKIQQLIRNELNAELFATIPDEEQNGFDSPEANNNTSDDAFHSSSPSQHHQHHHHHHAHHHDDHPANRQRRRRLSSNHRVRFNSYGDEEKFDLMLSIDGSGIGAAVIAAVAVGERAKRDGVPNGRVNDVIPGSG